MKEVLLQCFSSELVRMLFMCFLVPVLNAISFFLDSEMCSKYTAKSRLGLILVLLLVSITVNTVINKSEFVRLVIVLAISCLPIWFYPLELNTKMSADRVQDKSNDVE